MALNRRFGGICLEYTRFRGLFLETSAVPGGRRPGTPVRPGSAPRRLTARSLLPPEPRLPQGEDRAESRVSPRKSDRLGLFYGEGEGAGSVASISGLAGMESPDGESPVWVGDDERDSGVLGH